MEKPLIDLGESSGLGLIIEWPSGVRYTNQTGGTSCHHPEIEGVFVPPSGYASEIQDELDQFFTGPKWKGACYGGIDEETADFLESVFTKTFTMQAVRVDRTRLADSEEAWIHVLVSPRGETSEIWSGFSDLAGVATWENSD